MLMPYWNRLVATLFVVGLVTLAAPNSADAQRRGSFGVGLGSATGAAGISLKKGAGPGFAYQGVIGTWRGWGDDWHFGGDSLAVAGDFLYQMPSLASGAVVDLSWNYGLGAGLGVHSEGGVAVGGSGVLGLQFDFVPAPIDLALEYRPGLYVTDRLHFAIIDFSGHLRFWF
jgi:hypothetical protein